MAIIAASTATTHTGDSVQGEHRSDVGNDFDGGVQIGAELFDFGRQVLGRHLVAPGDLELRRGLRRAIPRRFAHRKNGP
jgi:hypothetical protein